MSWRRVPFIQNIRNLFRKKRSKMDKHELVCKAILAQAASRYEDMGAIMSNVAIHAKELDQLDRKLFSDAFKERYELRRNSIELLVEYRHAELDNLSESEKNHISIYIDTIKEELRQICNEVLQLIDTYLIPKAKDNESSALYFSLRGDYKRYLVATITESTERTELVNSALVDYESAFQLSQNNMVALDPTRLGVALNYAVFIHDTLGDTTRACQFIQQVLDDACTARAQGRRPAQVSSNLLLKCEQNLLTWRIGSGDPMEDMLSW